MITHIPGSTTRRDQWAASTDDETVHHAMTEDEAIALAIEAWVDQLDCDYGEEPCTVDVVVYEQPEWCTGPEAEGQRWAGCCDCGAEHDELDNFEPRWLLTGWKARTKRKEMTHAND